MFCDACREDDISQQPSCSVSSKWYDAGPTFGSAEVSHAKRRTAAAFNLQVVNDICGQVGVNGVSDV